MNREYREWFGYVLLSVVMFLGEISFAPALSVLFLISPLPFMLLQYRFGTRSAMYAAFIAVLSIYLPDVITHGMAGAASPVNLITVLMFMVFFVFTGMLLGTILRLKLQANVWLLRAVMASAAAKIAFMVFLVKSIGINPFAMDEALVNAVVSSISQTAGVGGSQTLQNYVHELSTTMKMLLPSILIFYAAADSFCSYKLAGRLLKRKGIEIPVFTPFGEWRFPKDLSFAIIAAILLKVAVTFMPSYALQMVSENLHMVLRAVFTLEGMSVIWYLMGRNKITKALRLVFMVFSIIFLALFTYPYSFIGIIDIWYDLRKLGGKNNESNS